MSNYDYEPIGELSETMITPGGVLMLALFVLGALALFVLSVWAGAM